MTTPPDPPPEITAFETPEGAPAWGFEIPEFSVEKELPHIKTYMDRTSALALVAAKLALADAGLLEREKRPAGEIGCAHGTALGCLDAMTIFWNKVKTSNPKFAQPLPFTHGYANSPSSLLCIEYGLRGPAATFSGERLAGVEALLFAYDQIAAGAGEIILAGASESLSAAAYHHLLASGQLSRSGTWDDGIVPGEGAAMVVLESAASAQRRGAKVLAEVTAVDLGPRERIGAGSTYGIGSATMTLPSSPAVTSAGAFEMYRHSGDVLAATAVLATAAAAGWLSGRYALSGRRATADTESVAVIAGGDGDQGGVVRMRGGRRDGPEAHG